MASNPQIIADIKVIMEMGQKLEMLATYKGVPFVCRASVEAINDDFVRLKTLDASIICLVQNGLAKILGSDYFEPATAEVKSSDIARGALDLTNFSYIGAKLGERMIVRVEPKGQILATIECLDIQTTGELVDISISGMGMRVALANYNSLLKPGSSVQINMAIPSTFISVSGTVLSAFKTDETYRLSIRFAPDISQRSLIFRYLIDRRHEIEQEVHAEYEKYLEKR